MEFSFETAYDQTAVTAMVKALRKTVRKKRSRRSHIVGVLVAILAIVLTLPLGGREFVLDFRTVFTWLIAAILLLVLVFEDWLNACIARKRMLPGLAKASVTFLADRYCSETELGSSEFHYQHIQLLAETADYFIFVFSQNHAQVYDKRSISGGTLEEFRAFIAGVTGKEIHSV